MRPLRSGLFLFALLTLSLAWNAGAQTNSNSVPVLTTLAPLAGQPFSGLVLGADGNFYGVTEFGGGQNAGSVFRASLGGVITNIYSFTGGADGANPAAALAPGPGGVFYGTTSSGGNTSQDPAGAGTVFQISTNGALATLYTFSGGTDGDTPLGGLVRGGDGAFYGTTMLGGDEGYGAAYRITSSGAFTNLCFFDYIQTGGAFLFPNGSSPASSLVQGGDGKFYGTTQSGGASGLGGLFQLTPAGALSELWSFTAANGGSVPNVLGPELTVGLDGKFYGVTYSGGSYAAQDPSGVGFGTMFSIDTNGAFSQLYSFSGGADGANPVGRLARFSDGSFYGVTESGGGNGVGTIFNLGANGVLTTLYTFTGGSDGGNPPAGLALGGDGNWYGVTSGTFFRLGFSTVPFITTQPLSQTNAVGATITFTVVAGGSAPLSYQWLFNGTNLPGAAGPVLTLANAQSSQAGNYAVVVSNPGGSVTSSNAILSLYGAPQIVTQPASQGVVVGGAVDLTVDVAGTAPFTYQWKFDGTNLAGATGADLSLPNIQLNQSGTYLVVVGNTAGSVTSAPAVVLVTNPPPTILTQPSNQLIGVGQTAMFGVVAAGAAPLTYQWQFDGTNIPGATNATLGLANAQTNQSGLYDVIITDPVGSLTSASAVLSVSLAPVVAANPQSQTVLAGTNVTFTVAAGGIPPLSYQWVFGGQAIKGATNPALVLTNVATGGSGLYAVVVTNTRGSVTSSPPALLVVNDAYTVVTLSAGGIPPFRRLTGVAVDGSGNVYASDTQNQVVWKASPNGAFAVLAGKSGRAGSADGLGTNATFNGPSGLAVDGSGNVYVADSNNQTIRVITSGGIVSTFAGTAGKPGSANGQGAAARFAAPTGVAVDKMGNVFVADQNNQSIRKITPGGLVTTYAGAAGSSGIADGPAATARFSSPAGVAVDTVGNVYVADSRNGTIRMIATNGIVSTLAGNPRKSGGLDGIGTGVLFSDPQGVAVDNAGNVYVADTFNNTIRLMTTNGVVTTQAGRAGQVGQTGGLGYNARFNFPSGVALDGSGAFYVADQNNGQIRKGFLLGSVVAPAIITQPQNQTVAAGSEVVFTVGVSGTSPLAFQWSHGSSALPGATAQTLILTNVQAANAGTYGVVVTNLAGKVTSARATLQVTQGGGGTPQTQTIVSPSFSKGTFGFSVQTQTGFTYTLEYKKALTDAAWTTLQAAPGTGAVISLSDTSASDSTRFYRISIQ